LARFIGQTLFAGVDIMVFGDGRQIRRALRSSMPPCARAAARQIPGERAVFPLPGHVGLKTQRNYGRLLCIR
jgi:hypothetical protein